MNATAIELLKKHGLRVTQTRLDVIGQFITSKEAISSNDIESSIQNLDRITLYRTLKTFEEKGLIHQAIDGTQKPKFALCREACNENHHHDQHAHFHCSDCGKTICVEDVSIPPMPALSKVEIKTASLILQGRCEDCM